MAMLLSSTCSQEIWQIMPQHVQETQHPFQYNSQQYPINTSDAVGNVPRYVMQYHHGEQMSQNSGQFPEYIDHNVPQSDPQIIKSRYPRQRSYIQSSQEFLYRHPQTSQQNTPENSPRMYPQSTPQENAQEYVDRNLQPNTPQTAEQVLPQQLPENTHLMTPQQSSQTARQLAFLEGRRSQQQSSLEKPQKIDEGSQRMLARPMYGKIYDPDVKGFVSFSGYIFYPTARQQSPKAIVSQPQKSSTYERESHIRKGIELSPDQAAHSEEVAHNREVIDKETCVQFCVTESREMECCAGIEEGMIKAHDEVRKNKETVKETNLGTRNHEGKGEDENSDVLKDKNATDDVSVNMDNAERDGAQENKFKKEQNETKIDVDDEASESEEERIEEEIADSKAADSGRKRNEYKNIGKKKNKNENQARENVEKSEEEKSREEDGSVEKSTEDSPEKEKISGDRKEKGTNQRKFRKKKLEESEERDTSVKTKGKKEKVSD